MSTLLIAHITRAARLTLLIYSSLPVDSDASFGAGASIVFNSAADSGHRHLDTSAGAVIVSASIIE